MLINSVCHKNLCWVYTVYTKPVCSLCKNPGLVYHFFTDDSQLCLSFKSTDVAQTGALCSVENCLNDIVAWMHVKHEIEQGHKTEVIVLASKRNTNAKFVENVTVTVDE